MEINVFLNPIRQDFIDDCNLHHPRQIGNSICIYKDENDFPDLNGFQLAVIGVEEERNSFNNQGCKDAPNVVRKYFYQLFNHWNNIKIIDLGNIKCGFDVEDTYFALNKVFTTLLKYHIIPIIVGGSQDLTYPIYQVYENTGKLVNITAIDSRFDIGQDNEKLSSNSYLSYIILHQPNFLFNYSNIGYQNYYVDNQGIDLMKQLLFDVLMGALQSGLVLVVQHHGVTAGDGILGDAAAHQAGTNDKDLLDRIKDCLCGDEAVADIETNEDFDLMFHTVFCPNIEDRFGETEDENISLNM